MSYVRDPPKGLFCRLDESKTGPDSCLDLFGLNVGCCVSALALA